jgi:mycothiol S-conjugate amidase
MAALEEPRLRLLSVHAHPDDEASKGAGSVAKYHDEGAFCSLVCCTGGEAGDILNPAMDTPEVRERLHAVRMEELAESARLIGYDEVVMLGYRDSGMPGSDDNADPRCFARADFDEAVGRLVAIIRRVRPQVVITYPDIQDGYAHPDHLRVHDVTIAAVREANSPAHPWAGPQWNVSKLYYTMWARARAVAIHEKLIELGIESPYDAAWFTRPWQDFRTTTQVDVTKWYDRRKGALLAHATQIDPLSPFWFALPDEHAASVYPWEDYHLARATVPVEPPEDDLFAGVREELFGADADASD